MFFLCYHPLFREEFATCSPVAQPMALESFIMRSARWMGLKRKNGVWDMCWGDMTGWRIRYSHRNPWTPAVTIWSLHGHGAPLLRQIHTWSGPSLCILTLRLLMSYIYGAPSKARNTNVVYIWTYVWQRWNSLFLFAAQCLNTESMQRGFLCHICV